MPGRDIMGWREPTDIWYCGHCGSQLDRDMKCPNCTVESVPATLLDDRMPEWKSTLSKRMRQKIREKLGVKDVRE